MVAACSREYAGAAEANSVETIINASMGAVLNILRQLPLRWMSALGRLFAVAFRLIADIHNCRSGWLSGTPGLERIAIFYDPLHGYFFINA